MSMMSSQTPHREYATRPIDERYASIESLVSAARMNRYQSVEKTLSVKDLTVKVQDVPSGKDRSEPTVVLASPKGVAAFTHWSFGQLARTVGAPAGYLRGLPPELAAECLNHGISQTPHGTDCNLYIRAPKPVTEPGQIGETLPVVRAATSERYGRMTDHALYGAIQETITDRDPQWHAPATWGGEPAGLNMGDRDSFVILVNGGSIVNDPTRRNGEGEMFKGILIRNSEVGAAAVAIERILFRAVCGNHLLMGAVMDQVFRRRHVGHEVTRDTLRHIYQTAKDWAQASPEKDQAIINSMINHEIATTREGVISELRKMGATKPQAEAAYDACERTEEASPRSAWGIVQGITRSSQASGYQDDRFSLDQFAVKVMQRALARQAA